MSRHFLVALSAVTSMAALAAAPALSDAPLHVTVERAELADREGTISFTGIIEASHAFGAGFPSGGQVISVAVEAGETVAPGDLLAEMDPTQAREALRAAEAALASAEASLRRAEQEIERDRQLARRGYLSQAVLDQAEQGLVSARAARDQAEAQVETARKALEDTRLVSSHAAIVTARNAEPGQVVAAAQSVVDLAEIRGREAVFIAPNGYLHAGLIGRRIALHTLEPPARDFEATISYISPMIDSQTGGVMVKALIDEADAAEVMLKEPVSGDFPLALGKVASLPAAALTRDARGPALWLVNETGRVILHPVEIARYSTDEIFVSSGLSGGETVVVDGASLLYPDRMVEVAEKAEGSPK